MEAQNIFDYLKRIWSLISFALDSNCLFAFIRPNLLTVGFFDAIAGLRMNQFEEERPLVELLNQILPK